MTTKNKQSKRLTEQHKVSQGVVGIFTNEAKIHDSSVGVTTKYVLEKLKEGYPHLTFRYRKSVSKKEINNSLKKLDPELGQTLFVSKSCIKPDGGIIEVKDKNGEWRVVLISEAKFQGKDIENIKKGILVGKLSNQDTMVAGNAIERAPKNIIETRNLMMFESHFPYVLFLEGSNFLTETISITNPDGRKVILSSDSGSLNRLDRLTALNYGMPINTNLCKNKNVFKNGEVFRVLQSTSIYTKGNGENWNNIEMFDIMIEISKTSITILSGEL
jgi:type II restriction enzyme